MPGRIIRSPQAREDLIGIGAYIASYNETAAERLINRIEKRMRLLAKFPHSGTQRPDLAPGLRCVSVRKYILFFRPIEGGIELVRVLHGARDYESLFREELQGDEED
jgi:toxin ParE1/3/4